MQENTGPPEHFSARPDKVLPLRKNFYPDPVAECLIPLLMYEWPQGQPFFPCVITIGGRTTESPKRVQWLREVAFSWTEEDGTKGGPTWLVKEDVHEHMIEFVRLIQEDLELIRSTEAKWNFVHRGLEYFLRGSYGLDTEAFLWNMAALEAFLQERNMPGGVTAGLTHRVVRILDGWQPKKVLRESFRELYNIRSRVLHGDVDEVNLKHLTQLQQIVQMVALWLVRFLGGMARVIAASDKDLPKPSRSDLLRLLDIKDIEATRFALSHAPDDFPNLESVVEGYKEV